MGQQKMTVGAVGLALGLALTGCGCSSGMRVAAPPEPGPEPGPAAGPDAGPVVVVPSAGAGPDTTVSGFAGAQVYFLGADNKRTLDAPVVFPEMPLTYERITLSFALRCPPVGGCDAWDRRGFIGVVRRDGATESVTEILRFMTPYRVGATWSVDVTQIRPLLSGAVTLRLFIDTWVGPGNAAGAGWLVDASFELKGGRPARIPIAVLPVWDDKHFDYGDPAKPISASMPARTLNLPAEAGAVELRAFISGHGQGNLDNCAEFCPRTHTFKVGDTPFARMVWRNDCATTAAPNQAGNFRSSRAGWCPGDFIPPWTSDVTGAVTPGGPVTISYDVTPYENTCRPDATPCGCGTGCAYNSTGHTLPFYELSAALVVYAR
jgi:Peptide-N-glycosidase F, C terminal/Peptide-N-glycosidase F, N terminal